MQQRRGEAMKYLGLIISMIPFTVYANELALEEQDQSICKIEHVVPKDIFNFEKYFEEELSRALAHFENGDADDDFFLSEREEFENAQIDAMTSTEESASDLITLVDEESSKVELSSLFKDENSAEFQPSSEAIPKRSNQLAERPKITTSDAEKSQYKKPATLKSSGLSPKKKAVSKGTKTAKKNIVKRDSVQGKKSSASKRPSIEVDSSED